MAVELAVDGDVGVDFLDDDAGSGGRDRVRRLDNTTRVVSVQTVKTHARADEQRRRTSAGPASHDSAAVATMRPNRRMLKQQPAARPAQVIVLGRRRRSASAWT